MQNKENNVFPWNGNVMVEQMYMGDNYKIINFGSHSANVILFFSGNGLYFPNTEEIFRDVICKNDRYEWENVAKSSLIQKYYSKIIFIRDIYKQWYVKGINNVVNSVTKVLELLRSLTKGYDVTTCGNSAGGYMAMLVGKELGAKRIFSFSGQFSCWNQLYKAPLLKLCSNEPSYNQWYNLEPSLKKSGIVFHFYPAHCRQDVEQFELAKSMYKTDFYFFAFNGDSHGHTVESDCYEYLLTANTTELIKLSKRNESRLIVGKEFFRDTIPCYRMSKEESECVRKEFFSGMEGFYIWGTGYWGGKCRNLFERLGLVIEGFIDNNKIQNTIHGYHIFKPNEIKGEGIICVASKKYENEIMEQIRTMGFEQSRRVRFTQLEINICKYLERRR